MNARLALVVTTLACAPLGCKTAQEALSRPAAVEESKPPQCQPSGGFKGVCQVADVAGRQGTVTEAARASALGEIVEMRLSVQPSGGDGHAQVAFFRKTGLIDDWAVEQALDLYSRQGCIAEISGGVFGDGYTPKVTLRVLMNLADDGRTAFAELSDFRTGKAVHAMLALKCDWQK